jgi:DNA-binding Lrp family transcriptional regulator
MEVKKSFVEMPETVLEKKLSLRAVYIYAKMLMFAEKDVVYNRKCWVTNPYSRKQELSEDALSDITKKLVKAGLIKIVPVETTKSRYKTNTYEIMPFKGMYKPVAFDFINGNLSAEAKGLAILMSLLQYIPKSASAIGKAIGISGKTVKKYLTELEAAGVYNPETRLLNEDYFIYKKQVEEKRLKQAMDEYEEWLQVPDKKLPERIKRQREYVIRLDVPEKVKALIFSKSVVTGLMGRRKEVAPKINVEIRL